MEGKITIKANIPEGSFIEGLLNMKHSGVSDNYILACLLFYAMAKSWHVDMLSYYMELLEVEVKG